jgi:hypothetical protein
VLLLVEFLAALSIFGVLPFLDTAFAKLAAPIGSLQTSGTTCDYSLALL